MAIAKKVWLPLLIVVVVVVAGLTVARIRTFFGSEGIYTRSRRDVEKPVHVELFEPDGWLGFSIDAGAQIYGSGGALGQPQKALAIFARDQYGYPELDYRLFPDLDIDVFEAFVLRNAGNEWEASQFQDGIRISSQPAQRL